MTRFTKDQNEKEEDGL